MKWEYKSFYLHCDETTDRHWLHTADDGVELNGVENILNYYGNQCWELVQLIYSDPEPGTRVFRFVFKRPVRES